MRACTTRGCVRLHIGPTCHSSRLSAYVHRPYARMHVRAPSVRGACVRLRVHSRRHRVSARACTVLCVRALACTYQLSRLSACVHHPLCVCMHVRAPTERACASCTYLVSVHGDVRIAPCLCRHRHARALRPSRRPQVTVQVSMPNIGVTQCSVRQSSRCFREAARMLQHARRWSDAPFDDDGCSPESAFPTVSSRL